MAYLSANFGLALPADTALWFLPLAGAVSLWVAYNDMRYMKIPNLAVLALAAAFVVTAPFALPLADIPVHFLAGVVTLVAGFVANLARLIGAGDAKFAAAMALFVAPGDYISLMMLFCGVLLAAFASHRILRAVPVVRGQVGHWASVDRADFPMGLALGGTLLVYLAMAALA